MSALEPNRRQLVVAFTDGVDTSSVTIPDRLTELAQRTNASITSVVPFRMGPLRPSIPDGAGVLQRLGVETGGTFIPATSVNQDLTETFRRALGEFRSSYVLHYTPRDVQRGGYHTLKVNVKRPGTLTVRARRGYFWG